MKISIDQQVAQLAAEGHQEIAVIKLPSQANRKKRTPAARKPRKTMEAAPTTYTTTQTLNVERIRSSYNRQLNTDRRAAAQQRAEELKGQPIF